MGKPHPQSSDDSDQSEEKVNRRRRRKKDQLEEIRRNALVTKRNLKTRASDSKKSQNSFMKDLHQLASARNELEKATQSKNLLLSSNTDCTQVFPKPQLIPKGFFRGAVKGKLITHHKPVPKTQEKLRNAVLNNDALQLMQSVGHSKSEGLQNTSTSDLNIKVQKEIAMIYNDSSQANSSTRDSLPNKKLIEPSPVLGRNRSSRKNSVSSDENNIAHMTYQNNQAQMKLFTKEEKCKRRLFEDGRSKMQNEIVQPIDNERMVNKSTPENVIFFTENIPPKNVNNTLNKKSDADKIKPTDPKFIECLTQITKIEDKGFENFLRNFEDPKKTTKKKLVFTYSNTFKDDIRRQKLENTVSTNSTAVFRNSKIMLEPDSAIRRTLKNNSALQTQNVKLLPGNNSYVSSDELHNSKLHSIKDSIQNNDLKKNHLSPNVNVDIPYSTKLNAASDNARVMTQINFVHEDRQEIVARYLKDVNTNIGITYEDNCSEYITEDNSSNSSQKEQLFPNNVMESHLMHKNTRHVPAILRKSRSMLECTSKEKNVSPVEKSLRPKEIQNKSFIFNSGLESERTPNCGNSLNNQSLEAPKSKFVHMNAKYNQPSRINAVYIQNKEIHKNRNHPPEKHLFKSPKHVEKNFVVMQPLQMSPIKQPMSYFDNKQDMYKHQSSQDYSEINDHGFYPFQLSQGNSQQDNSMVRMVSFGDIQERTNQLTLRSSQNLNCSQGSSEQICSSQEDYRKLPLHLYKQHELPNKYLAYTNKLCESLNKVTTPKIFNIPITSSCNCNSQRSIDYKGVQSCACKNNLNCSQSNNFSFQDSDRNYQINNCPSNGSQNLVRQQKALMNSQQVRSQISQQPVKFIAIEENNGPQRQPVYSVSENNHVHKTSIPSSQQYAVIMNPVHSSSASNLSYRAIPTMQCCSQDISQTTINPDIQCNNVCRVNNIIPSNVQQTMNFNGVISRSNGNFINYVPNNMNDQISVNKQNMPMHAVINKNCIEQHVPMQQLPVYSQVRYIYDHRDNNEAHNLNSVYLQL